MIPTSPIDRGMASERNRTLAIDPARKTRGAPLPARSEQPACPV